MTLTLEPPRAGADARPRYNVPARRAVVRWARRLFRREWRQQVLIVALITVAVAGTIVGSAVAVNSPQPKDFGFGTAQDAVTFTTHDARTASVIADLRHRFGRVQVIDRQTQSIPGSIDTFQLVAEDPHGPFTGPMLSLLAGRYPTGPAEVAVSSGVASAFHLRVGAIWTVGGAARRVVGMVDNPQSLLDRFALVAPGQVADPTQVTALFDAPGVPPRSIGHGAETPASVAPSNPFNPETISLAALVLGMLLVALVSVGGFTVLAQRRMRSIGMLESNGATDRHVRLVVEANGVVVGLAGAVLGFALGLVAWLAYRPRLEQSAHHVIGVLALPWVVVAAAMVLAVVASYLAVSRPARAVTKVPVVQALSGRPAPPRQVHRSAVPGFVLLVMAFLLLAYAGGTNHGNGGSGAPEILLGLVLLVAGLIMQAPFFLSLAARLGRRAPIAVRLALRDLARYRARSGSALAAISVGVLVAVIVVILAAARYGNPLDYAGPNLTSDQLTVQPSLPPQGQPIVHRNASGQLVQIANPPSETADPARLAAVAAQIATGLGARLVPLEVPDAGLDGHHLGRQWNGPIFVATPQLLRTFGISPSDIDPNADILTARPGLAGVPGLVLNYGTDTKSASSPGSPGGGSSSSGCTPANDCAVPVIQELGKLPAGTSAPNTVVTEHAVRKYHLQATTSEWLIQGTGPFSAAQIAGAQLTASTTQLSVESKNDLPSSSAVIGWATFFGIVIALCVLAMSVGLVRSETAADLRTLAATGASGSTRRMLTAVTAGGLGFLGALLGTIGGYLGVAGFLQSNSLNGGIAALGNVPAGNLLLILLGMPALAAAAGWLLAGREPAMLAHQPME